MKGAAMHTEIFAWPRPLFGHTSAKLLEPLSQAFLSLYTTHNQFWRKKERINARERKAWYILSREQLQG